jgi:hypothetical protein
MVHTVEVDAMQEISTCKIANFGTIEMEFL